MVRAGFENAGVPGSSPGVAIEDEERRTQPCAHRAGLSLCALHTNQRWNSKAHPVVFALHLTRAVAPPPLHRLTTILKPRLDASRGCRSPIHGNLLAAGCLIRFNEFEPTDHRLDEEQ